MSFHLGLRVVACVEVNNSFSLCTYDVRKCYTKILGVKHIPPLACFPWSIENVFGLN